MTTPPSRSTSARSLPSSDASCGDDLARPGRAVNAAIAPSRAILRRCAMVVRSTPASAAASVWLIWPVSIRTHKSYFCSADKNRFALRVEIIALVLLGEGQQPCQMRSETSRILSREVSGNTVVRGGGGAAGGGGDEGGVVSGLA